MLVYDTCKIGYVDKTFKAYTWQHKVLKDISVYSMHSITARLMNRREYVLCQGTLW